MDTDFIISMALAKKEYDYWFDVVAGRVEEILTGNKTQENKRFSYWCLNWLLNVRDENNIPEPIQALVIKEMDFYLQQQLNENYHNRS